MFGASLIIILEETGPYLEVTGPYLEVMNNNFGGNLMNNNFGGNLMNNSLWNKNFAVRVRGSNIRIYEYRNLW